MGSLSDKIKITYLLVVIVFALGVFFYLLDTWGIINLEDYYDFRDEAAQVAADADNPTELELERIKKEKEHLEEEMLKLAEVREGLQSKLAEIKSKEEDLNQREKGLADAEKAARQAEADKLQREAMVAQMAERLVSMPPQDAVAIVAGWSNADTVDVFKKMEQTAAANGRQSIVPYMLTLMPRERAAIITTLMMDAEAQKIAVNAEELE